MPEHLQEIRSMYPTALAGYSSNFSQHPESVEEIHFFALPLG
jgi:hypothetical protein